MINRRLLKITLVALVLLMFLAPIALSYSDQGTNGNDKKKEKTKYQYKPAASKKLTWTPKPTAKLSVKPSVTATPVPDSIRGIKFSDTNMDGKYQAGERGVAGVTIRLYNSKGQKIGEKVTDKNGYYTFWSLKPDRYTVTEVLPPHFINTTPASVVVTLKKGGSADVCFGNVELGGIDGILFMDNNMNQHLDNSDYGLDGWTINLFNASGFIGSDATDSHGAFSFDNLLPGVYSLRQVLKSGYLNVTPLNRTITIGSGQDVNVTQDYGSFGNIKLANISGITYMDVNINGLFDNGDYGLRGWTINLYTHETRLHDSTTTDYFGRFKFESLPPGTYRVEEVWKKGFEATSSYSYTVNLQPGQDVNITQISGRFGNVELASVYGLKYMDVNMNGRFDGVDYPLANWTIELSNFRGPIGTVVTDMGGGFRFDDLFPGSFTLTEVLKDGFLNTTPLSIPITLGIGERLNVTKEYDAFGNIQYASVEGIKYRDDNVNGIHDAGEPGLPGWSVYLANSTSIIASAITDNDGFFKISAIPGTYTINEDLKPGFINTSPRSRVITLGSGDNLNVTEEYGLFGNTRSGRILGRKYLDVNQNGQFDNGDYGLGDWTIRLYGEHGLVGTETTINDGLFIFANLVPGEYTVEEELQDGYRNTTPSTLDVTVGPGQNLNITNTYGAFGNIAGAGIEGIVYMDVDENGFFDHDDYPLAGWVVELHNKSGLVRSVVTEGQGTFRFDDLKYEMYAVTEILQGGYTNVSDTKVTMTMSPGNFVNVTEKYGAFGNIQKAQIAAIIGMVYDDTDGDGKNGYAEKGLPGWTVTLDDGHGISRSLTTDKYGMFTFSPIAPGTYTISETLQQGYVNTTPTRRVITVSADQTLDVTKEYGIFGNQRAPAKSSFAYTANSGDNTVSVIDTSTNKVTGTIKVGEGPEDVVFTPDGKKAYTANLKDGTVSVIDTSTHMVIKTIKVGSPISVDVSPDGKKVYAANFNDAMVSVIDALNDIPMYSIKVDVNPRDVTFSPDGSRAYVACEGSARVSVIDVSSNYVIYDIFVGKVPYGVDVSPDGKKLYVATYYENRVYVVDTSTYAVELPIGVGERPVSVTFSPDGKKAYSANLDNTVSAIDTATEMVTTISVGYHPYEVAVSQDSARAYVANNLDNTVSVIDTATDKVIDTIKVGANPAGVAVYPVRLD